MVFTKNTHLWLSHTIHVSFFSTWFKIYWNTFSERSNKVTYFLNHKSTQKNKLEFRKEQRLINKADKKNSIWFFFFVFVVISIFENTFLACHRDAAFVKYIKSEFLIYSCYINHTKCLQQKRVHVHMYMYSMLVLLLLLLINQNVRSYPVSCLWIQLDLKKS